ncbi:MAG: 1-(5-phosphoribosyl)-5-[(5-phosphoribosylamino)methylideneamino]imidazole-4-carboxamide isomerase [Desulfobacterales bacterium]|jgi:phosphoribosylformimino-5-aminoimidazole carboxamide ribotide isomerase|nr:1-(5-phosphoribosyl)-5-[(5-phosphoribosylamino)methylideneamino]imidazole-4-carboxamide isomerase [Desulfobacterales bacterium]
MIIIPAIDLKEGKCVRLMQGKMDKVTVFSNDPVDIAMRWEDRGAELIHIVDLDGSIAGSPKNTEVIEKIVKSINVPIQLGGGIRDLATINQYISIGVSRVIMGTMALEAPDLIKQACQLHPGRILVGIDAKDGRVAIRGWTEVTKKKAVDAAKEVEGFGVAAFIFTDIKRDGMQTGPNIENTKKLAQSVTVPVIASGGVNTISDIEDLMKIEEYGVCGVIVGRAIYTNSLRLEDAIRLTRES